jgi:hypothetical protein
MAEIKDVKIVSIQNGSSNGKKKVTVGFNLLFSAQEAGKTFRYGIKLRAEDKPGDEEGTANNAALLHTFTFGVVAGVTFKKVTAQAGLHPYDEPNEVSIQRLNEDPGHIEIDVDPNTPPIKQPHKDEVYAVVTLVADEERSEPKELFY